MRLALVSDIHGNLAALEAVIADLESRRTGAHQPGNILKDLGLLHKEIKKDQRLASAESV